MKKITLLLGTARDGRFSEHVAIYLRDYIAKKEGIDLRYVDIRDFDTSKTIPAWEKNNPVTQPWKDIAMNSDAFIMVVPEYNHSFPGEFKVLLDMAYRDEYDGKKVATVGVSVGGFGGARMIESILPVYVKFGLRPIHDGMNISYVQKIFGEDGGGGVAFGAEYDEKIDTMIYNLL